MLIPVKFLRNWDKYNAGEMAGFDSAIAKRMVDELHIATYLKPVAKAEKVVGDNTPPAADSPKDELTKTEFERMNADELLALAEKRGINLNGATLKKDVKPILKAVLFPDAE